jgi:hypothetical protein
MLENERPSEVTSTVEHKNTGIPFPSLPPVIMKFLIIISLLVASGANATILDDATGDVQARTIAADVPAQQGWLDIQSLTIEENNTHAQLTVTFAEATPQGISKRNAVQFFYGDIGHRFEASDTATQLNWYKGTESNWEYQKQIGQITTTPITVTFHLPREDITDPAGVSLELGRTIEDFAVEVEPANTQYAPVNGYPISDYATVYDRMPDQGTGGTYSFILPLDPDAEFVWIANDDIRYSNGVAKTYEYKLELLNQGDSPEVFTTKFENLPEGWIAQSLRPVIESEPGEPASISMLLAVPFRHVHGETQSFDLVLESTTGITLRKPLHVSYLEIAQPAGHHPQVWTFETERGPHPVPVFSDFVKAQISTTTQETSGAWMRGTVVLEQQSNLYWCMPLSESLKVGLQPNDTAEGIFSTHISTSIPYDGEVKATIFLADPRDSGAPANGPCQYPHRHVSAIFQTDSVSVSFSDVTSIELPLLATSGKPSPPKQGQELFLHVQMTPTPGGSETELQPLLSVDTSVLMPLDEYHEVDVGAASVSNAVLKRAPGAAAHIETNILRDSVYSWVSTADWFTETGSEFVEFFAAVPEDAVAGTVAELAIQHDGLETATQRFFIVVDPGASQSDVLPLDAEATPPIPFVVLLAVLLTHHKFAQVRKK